MVQSSEDEFEKLDLGKIADILGDYYPQFSKCELVKMVAEFTRHHTCTCSLCTTTRYPSCQQVGEVSR